MLTIGFSGTAGLVQYGGADGRPPYSVAITRTTGAVERMSFLAGGQAAEVPGRFLLPTAQVEDIATKLWVLGTQTLCITHRTNRQHSTTGPVRKAHYTLIEPSQNRRQ
jgi:hypothetical protein